MTDTQNGAKRTENKSKIEAKTLYSILLYYTVYTKIQNNARAAYLQARASRFVHRPRELRELDVAVVRGFGFPLPQLFEHEKGRDPHVVGIGRDDYYFLGPLTRRKFILVGMIVYHGVLPSFLLCQYHICKSSFLFLSYLILIIP